MRTSLRRKASSMMMWMCCAMLVIGLALPAAASAAQTAEEPDAGAAAAAGPRNLKVTEVTHNTVSLEWEPAPGINDYWIWDTDNKYIFWANGNKQKVGGLQPDTSYSFYMGPDGVQVADLKPEQKSNVVTFTTLPDTSEYPDPPLTPPSFLKATGMTDNSVTLSWGASPGATGYDLYVNGEWKGGTWSNDATTITFAPEKGLVKGKTYIFEVGAQNPPNPVSANSNKVELVWGELAVPKDLQAVTTTRTTAVLGWAPVPGATGYDIYQDGKQVATSDSNHYVAEGLTEGQSYSFAVAAVNPLAKSALSEAAKTTPGSDYTLVTYYISWAAGEGGRNYKPEDMDVSQVTHINYAFADLCWKGYGTGAAECRNEDIPLQKDYVFDGEIIVGDQEVDLDHFRRLAKIREQNPHLKILASVGGWSWSKNFSNMAATEETRRAFANSVVKFLREYELDGIDLDWEYPVEGGEEHNSRSPEDRENFPLMTKAVRDALDAAGSEDGKYYLQTIASGQGDNFVINADLAKASADLDFINIMTYDYSGSWETLAHHNAPLYYDPAHPRDNAPRNNVLGGLIGHLKGGVPTYKLVAGVPFYGKGWQNCPSEGDGQYQTCSGGTSFGSWESGIFDFSELEKDYINKNGYVRHWNEAAKVAYLYNSDKKIFITYNDKQTMMYTASMVRTLDLAGAMNWEISGDRNKTLMTQLLHDLPINGKPAADALAAPKQLELAASGEDSLQVKWQAVPKASGYELFLNNQWKGYTANTEFTFTGLNSSTNYTIQVLAVDRTDQEIRAVSAASNALEAATRAPAVYYPPFIGVPSNKPALAEGQLETEPVKTGDESAVMIKEASAIAAIEKAKLNTFTVILPDDAQQAKVIIPQKVLAAIGAKGEQAALKVRLHQVDYLLPIGAWLFTTDVRLSIAAPSQTALDEIQQAAQRQKLDLVSAPLAFKLETANVDGSWKAFQAEASKYVSRYMTFAKGKLDVSRAAGVVYDPLTKQLRSVPAIFREGKDGEVTAELKRKGNGIYAVVESDQSFNDRQKAWAREDVAQAAAKLLLDRDEAGNFGGGSVVTRAELAAILVKALGIVPPADSASFMDVTSQVKYAGEIEAAKQAGLIKGKSDHRFDPNGSVTRQDMAVMISNALAYAGKHPTAGDQGLAVYADRNEIAAYARTAMGQMVDSRIMLGVSSTKLGPRAEVTRAEAAVTVMRMLRAAELAN
ncbi:glycosyl hydrolase family 18 protein [Paenibacillus sp. GCM10027626]|uniref:glycosyl hydrolase family 18 protein n=1 Tax=Paenibacillus sp. GCM10027626 TaxID=3273411 RepID=UPI003632493F